MPRADAGPSGVGCRASNACGSRTRTVARLLTSAELHAKGSPMAAELVSKGGRDRLPYRLNVSLAEVRQLLDEIDFDFEGFRADFKTALADDSVIDMHEANSLLNRYDDMLLKMASAVLITTVLDESGLEPAQRAAERSERKRAIRKGAALR